MSQSLPRALQHLKQDIRILLPLYNAVQPQVQKSKLIATTVHYEQEIKLYETQLPGSRVKVILVDCPAAFGRDGNPYLDDDGEPWDDNVFRFLLFSQVAVDVALNRIGLDWTVDLVHCNDWQSGMVPLLLDQFETAPATLFTIHNLAYMGLFPKEDYFRHGLPVEYWNTDGIEFHDQFSFIKGALNFSDFISTVSVQYAKEIQTKEFGCGLDGLLQKRSEVVVGIQNGIDNDVWNPGTDPMIKKHYNRRTLGDKLENKKALQVEMGVAVDDSLMLMGMITRLVSQKGLDLLLATIDRWISLPIQFVLLGSGDDYYHQQFERLAAEHPDAIAFRYGYDEGLAHRIEAGSDVFLMPSLFEPSGLNQLYSLRYGTLPLVSPVGGLHDTVNDISTVDANGFVMDDVSSDSLFDAIQTAAETFKDKQHWSLLQNNAMSHDYSWIKSAQQYMELYENAIKTRQARH